MVRRIVACIALASIASLAAAACGARGPLDDSPFGADSGIGTGELDAAPEAAPVVDAAPEAAPVDAGHDATIIDCVQCISNDCSMPIFQCIQSQPCQQAFACVAQMCLGGGGAGGLDPGCLLKCASGNATGALQVLQVFMCVTGTCGPDCATLLGGLAGLGGGGGGKRDGG